MADNIVNMPNGAFELEWRLLNIFPTLTPKQHEVLRLVGENRTSKEIAWELGISESAVNQRIESVRSRAGAPPRAELARTYRQYLNEAEPADMVAWLENPETGQPLAPALAPALARAEPWSGEERRADALVALKQGPPPPWRTSWPPDERVVPELLEGPNAGLSRTAAMVAIAAGMLTVAMAILGVMRTLSEML